ncbi:MAG: hypothetical protein ACFUZC_16655 [Chthoniobacteraceae bacterium]
MKLLWTKIKYHGEWLLLPLFIVLMLAAIRGVFWLTGRQPLDDPGELVSGCYRAIRIAMAVGFTGFTQGILFGWRGDVERATWWDHVLDSLCTLALLSIFLFAFWH